MKKYLKLLSAIVLVMGTMFITSCGDDEGGKAPVVPPAPIKTISLDYDGTGADVERGNFFMIRKVELKALMFITMMILTRKSRMIIRWPES